MKQYALICEETAIPFLANVIKGIQFVEIRAMDMPAHNDIKVLVTPVIIAPEPAALPDQYSVTDDSE